MKMSHRHHLPHYGQTAVGRVGRLGHNSSHNNISLSGIECSLIDVTSNHTVEAQ